MSLKSISIIVLSIVILLILGYGGIIIYFSWPITLGNVDKAGVFGDSFGVLTSLFSGLAFAGIVLTILLQREELQLQRKELSLTREELKLTREELQKQHITIKHQNFENTFFQMLRLHNDIVNAIDLRDSSMATRNVISTGRDCFVTFYNRITFFYQHEKRENPGQSEDKYLEDGYSKFWKETQKDLGHYFRYLYTIFKFVDSSDVDDKRFYTNIVCAQLSDHELLVLFYNCLYIPGVEKFKPLAEKFAIFDNLPESQLINSDHKNLFQPEAFGDVKT